MKVQVYKALDHLFCEPDKPIYSPIIKNETLVGYTMDNLITVCNQHDFVTAIPCPNRDYALLVFGKYPVQRYLLKSVGCINIKE